LRRKRTARKRRREEEKRRGGMVDRRKMEEGSLTHLQSSVGRKELCIISANGGPTFDILVPPLRFWMMERMKE
jgi:hypothetical protein